MMGLIHRRMPQASCVRNLACRYSVLASICVVFLFLGALFCINTCNLTSCDSRAGRSGQPWQQQLEQLSFTSRWWINRIFSVGEAKKALNAFLVVVIISSPGNREQRDTIRQTWLKDVKSDILHLFSIGSSLLEVDDKRTLESENSRFQDILFLSNVSDTYDSLTKKLLATLVWIDLNIDFQFLLKVDDDSFARLDDIAYELQILPNKHRLYWGFFNGRAHVQKKGKWAENDWVLCDRYVPYALGGGYVISSDLVHFVAKNADHLKLYRSEDVSLATWLAPVDLRRVHDSRFDTEYKSRGCFNVYLITHKQSAEQMREKFWLLQEKGRLCATEERERYSYEYNWKVLPSECCFRNDSRIP